MELSSLIKPTRPEVLLAPPHLPADSQGTRRYTVPKRLAGKKRTHLVVRKIQRTEIQL